MPTPMMLGQNLTDLEQHRREFVAGEAFRVQVLDDSLPASRMPPHHPRCSSDRTAPSQQR